MSSFVAKPEDGAVWITGASSGIGAETAIRLAKEGFEVYISARSQDALNKLAQTPGTENRIHPLPLDVTDREACIRAANAIIDNGMSIAMVILNAGGFWPARGWNLSTENFDKTYAVNFNGVVNCLVPAVESMKESGRGQVAIVASVSGYGGLKKASSYGSSKAALINMAEALKFDFDQMNIKTQIINPGFIDTPLTETNDFPMPFLMPLDKAADRVVAGLKKSSFEITFPRRFTYGLKLVNLLPYSLYFLVMGKLTADRKKSV
jgi:short-subunit dehydrogenase